MKKRKNKKQYREYPKYMNPRKDYHKIFRSKHLDDMMILRFMYKDQAISRMPSEDSFTLALMQDYMKEGHFVNGISCNLLSVFKKRDAIFWVKNQQLTNQDWNLKSPTKHISKKDYDIYLDPGYFGFCIKEVEQLSTTIDIYDDKGCKIRNDDVVCKVEHCPNIVNFWHFNIFLYGIDKSDNSIRIYRLDNEVSVNKVKKTAKTLMGDFFEILLTHSKLSEKPLPYQLYRKGKKWNRIKEKIIKEEI